MNGQCHLTLIVMIAHIQINKQTLTNKNNRVKETIKDQLKKCWLLTSAKYCCAY